MYNQNVPKKCFALYKMFVTFQNCFETFQSIPNKCLPQKVFWKLLVYPETFRFVLGIFWKNILEKFQDCSETFWVVLATCRDCHVFQNVPKCLICLETFQSIMEYFKISFENISKNSFRNISWIFRKHLDDCQ